MSSVGWDQKASNSVSDTLPVSARGKGCLVKIHPMDVQGGLIRIRDTGFLVGRDEDCHLVVRDEAVSRCHAKFELKGGAYYVKDLGSTNGIEYGGRRVDSKRIEEGDIVQICDYELRFSYQ